ncbi:MAG: amidohydrolase family protein [Novosphingobium sp.]|uniref:amidohydrolase n=1 Tax=Novosphingobium sp. TaxID=1874826 RepID=UPI0030167DD2
MVMVEETSRPVLVSGGTILTGGPEWSSAEALVARDGRVVATGTLDEMQNLAGNDPRNIDLDGATAMPGLIDSHPHAMHFAAFQTGQVDLLNAIDHADILARIRARLPMFPPGSWIQCTPVGEPHYFIRRWYTDLAEGRLPNRWELDQASSVHPIIITAWGPRTPNIVAMNSLALMMVGIGSITPDRVCDVEIEKDAAGIPTGILRGAVNNYYTLDPYWMSINTRLGAPPPELWEIGGLVGQQQMHALGVTAGYEAHAMERDHVLAWRALRDKGQLTMRVHCAVDYALVFQPQVDPSEEEILARLANALTLRGGDDDMYSFEGLSYGNGGPCAPGLMRTTFPYRDHLGRETFGHQFFSDATERRIIEFCLDNDVRLNVVQGGDRDQDMFFKLLAEVLQGRTPKGRGWVSQHNIIIREQHIQKLAELGIDVSSSISFLWGKGDLYAERIGAHIHDDQVPMKRMWDHGLTVANGTDWGPKNVFEHIALQESCRFCGSNHSVAHLPGHGLTRQQSLSGWTANGAKVMGRSDIGALRPGMHFDMTIADRNPLTARLEDLPGTQVLQTIVGGRTAHSAGALATL